MKSLKRTATALAAALWACSQSQNDGNAQSEAARQIAHYDSLSQALFKRNQVLSRTVDSLIVETINDRFSDRIQYKILQDTQKMDDYRRWVEESETILSHHSAATGAIIQELADLKARMRPFWERRAPKKEWIAEVESGLLLIEGHVVTAREAESRLLDWQKAYSAWLEELSRLYPPDS
ncbi:MAG: hypothetical protein NZ534_08435, partial [Bacteroidia bacterium]|nr:hypothetical protein [Bacteroidia bacterium]